MLDIKSKLAEFVSAQEGIYDQVVRELTAGRKQSHWMWFIFPQLAGLGRSQMARKFAIGSLREAKAYLQHAVLGPRLKECTQLMLAVPHYDVKAILGSPDDLKFRSCMTLFHSADAADPLFHAALEKFFAGEPDARTLQLLDDLPDEK
jgi:uncharacterized protein (DUF1810 family)